VEDREERKRVMGGGHEQETSSLYLIVRLTIECVFDWVCDSRGKRGWGGGGVLGEKRGGGGGGGEGAGGKRGGT